MEKTFVDVILPLPLQGPFTYMVPEPFLDPIKPGIRVIVQFGARKFYSAIIYKIHQDAPSGYEVKEVQSIIDEKPVIYPENLKLWNWISNYYCCTLGEIMKAALPAAMKLESQTKIIKTEGYDDIVLPENQELIFQNLEAKPKAVQQIQKELGKQFSFKALNTLIEKKLVAVEEKISDKYKPKLEEYIFLNPEIKEEQQLQEIIDSLKRAKKQQDLLLHFSGLIQQFNQPTTNRIKKKELLQGTHFSNAILKGLLSKNILKSVFIPVSRIDAGNNIQKGLNLLNPFQEEALQQIRKQFEYQQAVLLYGVTSSGKTEIYTHLIEEALAKGQQVLYLVPEISLATQLTQRLVNIFGKKVGISHSRLNDQERVEIWNKVLLFEENPADSYHIILGARSSVFLPFSNLGLIIVDEEHENSYKQFDPAPRYNARDMAVVLGYQTKANILLGTATPSFESYFNAKSGKFGLVELNKRYGKMELPDMVVADIQWAFKRKKMKSFFTPQLYDEIEQALAKKEQVILFQNRRGYAPFVECMDCGWIPKCNKCDVSLTYHKYKKQLTCHYCGYYMPMAKACHDCGSPELKTRGIGTEKIEDELKQLFPSARVGRMDLDSTRGKNAFEKIIRKLEKREIDILVGTQMVTKGLDFEHVSIVGVLNADNLLNFPDFRAHERSYQLISQVSGRAGRKHKQGKVVIQTSNPDHQTIKEIMGNAYEATFSRQIAERKLFKYPPYFRIVKIVVKHKNMDNLNIVAKQLATMLKENKELAILGPEFPLISRIKLWHHKEIWIKFSKTKNLGGLKTFITTCVLKVKQLPGNSSAIFNIDVDPM